jgi:hypothetical protein
MIVSIKLLSLAVALAIVFSPLQIGAQSRQPAWQAECDKTLEDAK